MEAGLMEIVRPLNRSWICDTYFTLYRAIHPGERSGGNVRIPLIKNSIYYAYVGHTCERGYNIYYVQRTLLSLMGLFLTQCSTWGSHIEHCRRHYLSHACIHSLLNHSPECHNY